MYYGEDDMLMLSGIQHYRFCPRQWALIPSARKDRNGYVGWHVSVRTNDSRNDITGVR